MDELNLSQATVTTIFFHLAEFLRKTGELEIFDTLVYNYRLKESLPVKTLRDFSRGLLELINNLWHLLNHPQPQSSKNSGQSLPGNDPSSGSARANGCVGVEGNVVMSPAAIRPSSRNVVEINVASSSCDERKQGNPLRLEENQVLCNNEARNETVEGEANFCCCRHCSKVFRSTADFQLHSCSNENPSSVSPESSYLLTKTADIQSVKRFRCGVCLKLIRSYSRISSHLSTCCVKNKPYTCNLCSTGSDEDLRSSFSSVKLLNLHKRTEHSCEKPFKCDLCGHTFRLNQSLVKHKKRRHEEQSFPCSLCDQIFDRRINLTNHKLKNHNEMKRCLQCGTGCASESALDAHIALKHGSATSKKFPCSFCTKVFPRKDKLDSHLSTHTGTKRFICATCGKGFFRKFKLEEHEARHRGIKKYACVQPNCDKAYASNSDLKIHLRNHHPEVGGSVPPPKKRIRKGRPRAKRKPVEKIVEEVQPEISDAFVFEKVPQETPLAAKAMEQGYSTTDLGFNATGDYPNEASYECNADPYYQVGTQMEEFSTEVPEFFPSTLLNGVYGPSVSSNQNIYAGNDNLDDDATHFQNLTMLHGDSYHYNSDAQFGEDSEVIHHPHDFTPDNEAQYPIPNMAVDSQYGCFYHTRTTEQDFGSYFTNSVESQVLSDFETNPQASGSSVNEFMMGNTGVEYGTELSYYHSTCTLNEAQMNHS